MSAPSLHRQSTNTLFSNHTLFFVSFFCFELIVSCGHPSPSVSGTIEPYNSTQEGAEVQYHCDEGYTPREWRTSQCQENGTWAPDPALLNCALGVSPV